MSHSGYPSSADLPLNWLLKPSTPSRYKQAYLTSSWSTGDSLVSIRSPIRLCSLISSSDPLGCLSGFVCILETTDLGTAVVSFVELLVMYLLDVSFATFVDGVNDSDYDDDFVRNGIVQKYISLNDQMVLVWVEEYHNRICPQYSWITPASIRKRDPVDIPVPLDLLLVLPLSVRTILTPTIAAAEQVSETRRSPLQRPRMRNSSGICSFAWRLKYIKRFVM